MKNHFVLEPKAESNFFVDTMAVIRLLRILWLAENQVNSRNARIERLECLLRYSSYFSLRKFHRAYLAYSLRYCHKHFLEAAIINLVRQWIFLRYSMVQLTLFFIARCHVNLERLSVIFLSQVSLKIGILLYNRLTFKAPMYDVDVHMILLLKNFFFYYHIQFSLYYHLYIFKEKII